MRTIYRIGLIVGTCALSLLTARPGYALEAGPATTACPPSPSLLSEEDTSSLPGSGTHPSNGPYRPAPEEILACVGARAISGADFARWAIVAEKDNPHPQPTTEPSHVQMEQVMGFLISSYWLLGEAQHLKIHPSSIAVRKRFDQLRHEQFRRPAAFRNFLKRSGQTIAELLFRVRVNMIESKIQRRIVGRGDSRSRQRALHRFIAKFQLEWLARTYCESPYATPDCGHSASTL
jgi:hypothetical protein